MRKIILLLLIGGTLVAPVAAQVLPDTVVASIEARIDNGYNAGIVVGIVDSSGTEVAGYGQTALEDGTTPDAQTLFEIGSVTKVFTSLLLADMVVRGEVALEDPFTRYLPDSIAVPESVTLEDLATHTSGLPRMPDNFAPADWGDPYADYTVPLMLDFLDGFDWATADTSYAYSNLGMGLLDYVLARRAGTSYGALVQERIARPLGLDDTAITLTGDQQQRLATGHLDGAAVPNWTFTALAGAGALRSTTQDMLRLVAQNAGLYETPLDSALALTHLPRVPTGTGMQVGLGWHIRPTDEGPVYWHNGGTGGYHSFVGFHPATQRGAVVLSNSETSIDDIGLHLLAPSVPLSEVQAVIDLPPEMLERYVGRYQLAPSFVITITREGDRLFAQATDQPPLRIYPASETEFFLMVVDAQITFTLNGDGEVEELVWHQGGRDTAGQKVE